jgi:hypothetical protein
VGAAAGVTPRERYEESCRRGIDPKEYCRKVLHSTNPDARKHKGFCLVQYVKLMPPGADGKDWYIRLKEKEELGIPLAFYQQQIWRMASEKSGRSVREAGLDIQDDPEL